MTDSSSSSTTDKIKKQKSVPPCPLNKFIDVKYELSLNRNYEQFLKDLGVRSEVREKALNSKPIIRLTAKGKKYRLITKYPEWNKETSVAFKLGEPITRKLKNDFEVTSIFTVKDGRKLMETQSSDDRTILISRFFDSEKLVVNMTMKNSKCDRFYKLMTRNILVNPSETSRRTVSKKSMISSSSSSSAQKEKETKSYK